MQFFAHRSLNLPASCFKKQLEFLYNYVLNFGKDQSLSQCKSHVHVVNKVATEDKVLAAKGVIKGLQATRSPRFFGHFWKCSEIAEFWRVGFILPIVRNIALGFFLVGCSLFLTFAKKAHLGITECFFA